MDNPFDFAKEKMAYLLSRGVDPQRAAAMTGNAWHESGGFKPTILGDNGDSYGLYQFNKRGELPAYQSWLKANNREMSDWKAQTDFVLDRMNSPQYATVWQKMKEAPDVRTATEAFMRGYERPKESAAALDSRINYADKAYSLAGSNYDAAAPSAIAYNAPQGSTVGLLSGAPAAPSMAPTQFAGNTTGTNPSGNIGNNAQLAMGLLAAGAPKQTWSASAPAPVHQGRRVDFFQGLLG